MPFPLDEWTLVTFNCVGYRITDSPSFTLPYIFSTLILNSNLEGFAADNYQKPFEQTAIWKIGGFLGKIANLRIYSPGAAYISEPGYF